MTEGRNRTSPTILGAILGTALVGFAVLLALFLRDVVLSGTPCTVDSRVGLAGVVLELCPKRPWISWIGKSGAWRTS